MFKNFVVGSLMLILAAEVCSEEAVPYQWEGALTLESISNLKGGVEKGTRFSGNLDVSLTVNTEAADWWSGGAWFAYVLGDYSKQPSEIIGDIQGVSNIQTYNNLSLYEFWYEHSFSGDAIKLLIGLHDYNSTFYSLNATGLYLLSSFGIGPDVSQVGPSIFPVTAPAVHLTIANESQYLLLAVYDGIPGDPEKPRGTRVVFKKSDGFFKAAEWGFTGEKNYNVALGAWQHTAEVESPIDGGFSNSNQGYYFLGEKYFSENLVAFLQYGRADADKNPLDSYLGVGVNYENLWKDQDAIGIGYASAHNGNPYKDANPDILSAENIWELTYLCPLTEKVSVQSSLFYVIHPSMAPALDNALALGLRAYISF